MMLKAVSGFKGSGLVHHLEEGYDVTDATLGEVLCSVVKQVIEDSLHVGAGKLEVLEVARSLLHFPMVVCGNEFLQVLAVLLFEEVFCGVPVPFEVVFLIFARDIPLELRLVVHHCIGDLLSLPVHHLEHEKVLLEGEVHESGMQLVLYILI